MTEAERALMRADVGRSLGGTRKQLSPKYFYDARGSALFDRITEQPEYYLTAAERRLIESFARPWLRRVHACTLVEPGAGSGDKTRRLLGALPDGAMYVPVDISAAYLAQIADELRPAFPHLEVLPVRADFTRGLALPDAVHRPLVVAFLGSTIGNFDAATAGTLLRRVVAALRPGDRFLLGVDLHKDTAALEASKTTSALTIMKRMTRSRASGKACSRSRKRSLETTAASSSRAKERMK
jgi:L-histidine Nalpha-methyltransferase